MLRVLKSLFREAAVQGGLWLFLAAATALIMANSNFANSYSAITNFEIGGSISNNFFAHKVSFSGKAFVNEFCMSFFFLLVGIEIKREMISGHLSDRKAQALPVISAIAGVIIPVLIYTAINYSHPEKMRGWAIPAATDIAFSLSAISIFGKTLPNTLKVFLTALAIIDDLIAIVVIAVFYTSHIDHQYIRYIFLLCCLLLLLNQLKIKGGFPYLILWAMLWYCTLQTGIHPTISSIVAACAIPASNDKHILARKLEKIIHPYVSYMILPMFAFVNSGIALSDVSMDHILDTVTMGVMFGLFVGKQMGVFCSAALLIKSGFVKMPRGGSYLQLYAVAILCGIGFTMSIFVSILSFDSSIYLSEAKAGILIGSLLSLLFGAGTLKLALMKNANAVD